MKKDIVLIIPCLNCEHSIGTVIKNSKEFLSKIIVIDDGSCDRSAEIAKGEGVKVVSIETNAGVGYALRLGFSLALESGYHTFITIDADGAHNPNNIPSLLETHFYGSHQLTIGNRWHEGYSPNISSAKWWANRFAARLVECVTGRVLPDVACGFRVLNRRFVEHILLQHNTAGFGFLYEMIFHLEHNSGIGYSPVEVRYNASTFLFTHRQELLQLLHVCYKWAKDAELVSKLERMIYRIDNWGSLGIRINDEDNRKITLIAYPIAERGGYIFQYQHPLFVTEHSNEFINI